MIFTLSDAAYVAYPLVPFRALCALAGIQGRLQYRTRARERTVVRRNLAAAFGDERSARDLDRLTRQAFEYRQLRGLLMTLMPRLGPKRVARLFPIEGIEHLDGSVSAEPGPIVVASHMNSLCNFQALELLRAKGYDLGVALPVDADPQPASDFRRLLDRVTGGRSFRDRTGAFYAQFNVRPIARRLKGGSGVLLVGDGWHSAGFVRVDFLGRPVFFTTGTMSLARLTGSPVVPMFVVGTPPDGLRIVFEEPIVPDPSLGTRADVERMVGCFVQRLEHRVREGVPCWQHWFEEDALGQMAALPDTPLEERYGVRGGPAVAVTES